MSQPGQPLGSDLFGSHRTVYPPAPPGYKYVDVNVPQAPPGYSVERMSTIARGTTPSTGTRTRYGTNINTPEGQKERFLAKQKLDEMHYELTHLRPNGESNDKVVNTPNLPAVIALLNQRQGIGAPQVNVPSRETMSNVPNPAPSYSLPGLPSADAPLADEIQSRLDSLTNKGASRSAVPQVLQEMWQNLTAPAGPAFDPSKVDLGEMKYNPLPEADETEQ